MSQIVKVTRINPKTTEEDFERFCSQFGKIIECVIYPENDKLSKRSGYVKFASTKSAEKMYHQSCKETFYIDQTSINVEFSNENFQKKSKIYTLNIEGQILDENELKTYFNNKLLNIKLIDNGAQIISNDKDFVEKILKEKHEKYTIKILSNKHEYEEDESIDIKRPKYSSNSYINLTNHLENLTKLTHNIYEENESLKNEKNLLTIKLNQQITKTKQIEIEKLDLIQSLNKTHDIGKCLTNQFKIREDEYKKLTDESNKKMNEYELLIKTTDNDLLKAKKQIENLTNYITTLELQLTQLESKYFIQQQNIDLFFDSLKNLPND